MYYNISKLIFYKSFYKLINNLKIIIKNKNMVLLFLACLPIVFYLIKIQIFIGFIFFVWFLFLYIIIFYVLNTEYIIKCEEIPLNTSRLKSYAVINVFIFVPKANAFIIFYNLLEFIKIKKNDNNIFNYYLIFVIIFIITILKLSILLVLGYSYFSLLITSIFVVKLFHLMKWKYEDNTAKIETIVINCFLDNIDSIGQAENKKIIIKKDEVIFNMKNLEFLIKFCKKVKKPELLIKSLDNNKITENKKIDNHYNFSIYSDYNNNKNISKNLTSSPTVKVASLDENGKFEKFEKIICKDGIKPNLVGQDKTNFLTFPYDLNMENAIITKMQPDLIINMQQLSKFVYNSVVLDANQIMLYSDNGVFYKNVSNVTVKEYAKEFKIGVSENISDLNDFLELNLNFFENEQNRKDLEIVIKILTNIDRDIIFDSSNNKIVF